MLPCSLEASDLVKAICYATAIPERRRRRWRPCAWRPLSSARPASSATLDDVRARGHLICGVGDGVAGFSHVDERGVWSGLDVDFCSAVAAAVFGRKDAVKFRPLSAANSFQALRGNEIDLLSRATTWTLSRDTELGLRYAGTIFHDGQGFLVRRGAAVASVLELSGASVCVLGGTSAEQGVVDYFRMRQMRYQLVVAERWVDLVKAYVAGTCTLLSSDVSVLALERSRLAKPGDHMLLPELITKQPSGPAVRQGDDQWFGIVKWTLMALDRGRGARPYERERRERSAHVDAVGHPALSRARFQPRSRHGSRGRLGVSGRQAGRQLRRDLMPATSAPSRRSRSSAASTASGRTAVSCMLFRCVDAVVTHVAAACVEIGAARRGNGHDARAGDHGARGVDPAVAAVRRLGGGRSCLP